MKYTQLSEALEFYRSILKEAEAAKEVPQVMRELCLRDLFFLLYHVLNRKDVGKQWLFDRCQEVQDNPNGYLDLWAREHFKSTIITFALTIQDILFDPEITIGIFSLNRPLGKDFLQQIKIELENNKILKELFPDVLYKDPRKEAPTWNLDDGLIVKRKGNPKESTVEAHGLIESMPTGKHFQVRLYDDVIDERNVTNPDMIKKAIKGWELSINLGSQTPTKRYGVGDIVRYCGTKYHLNDPYSEIKRRGSAIERRYPGTVDGKPDSEPVLWSREVMQAKRRDMGPYVFACHAAGTEITMGDWSQLPIERIKPGYVVVGWAAIKGGRSILTPTKVVAINRRTSKVVRSLMENGDVLYHTKDHNWWTGRTNSENGTRKYYSPLGFEYGSQKALCKAISIPCFDVDNEREHFAAAGYLAGIIDGEGGVKYRTVQITQDCKIHKPVCEKIEWALNVLGFEYGIFERKRGNGVQRMYSIKGGRQAKIKLLYCIGDFLGKKQDVVSQAYGAQDFGKNKRVKLKDQVDFGETEVFNIQTDTGNYIAGGYCSKNCQILVDPKADEAQGFLEPWLKFHGMHLDKLPRNYNYYLLCDPAGEKKKENDYTVMAVIATAPDRNIYVIDFIRDRLNLTERTETMFRLHRKYRPVKVGYEQYGLQADVEHIEYVQEIENYRFPIIKLGGSTPKNDRIRKLIPIFEQGRFYMPARVSYVDYQRHEHDLTREFIDEEFLPFPVGSHDDILDCFARIIDPELGARFPLERKFNDDAIQLGQRPSPQENRRRGYSEVYA